MRTPESLGRVRKTQQLLKLLGFTFWRRRRDSNDADDIPLFS